MFSGTSLCSWLVLVLVPFCGALLNLDRLGFPQAMLVFLVGIGLAYIRGLNGLFLDDTGLADEEVSDRSCQVRFH